MFSEIVGEDNGVREVVAVLGVDFVALLVVVDLTSTDVEVVGWADPCKSSFAVTTDTNWDK